MAPRKPIRPGVKTESKPEQKKRAEKQKSNEPGIWDMIKSFVSDERTRFVAGLMLLLGVLYLIMAFISYFISHHGASIVRNQGNALRHPELDIHYGSLLIAHFYSQMVWSFILCYYIFYWTD